MKQLLCKLHPDFHVPGEITDIGQGFDGMTYAKTLKKHVVDTIVVFAKCHYGFSYYPTSIGTVHPGLAKDLVHEIAEGAKAQDLECVCYYSVFLDTAAIVKNPSWRLQPKRGHVMTPGGEKYEPVCVNSAYLEELLLPQTLEVLEKYPIHQMFFDTMTGFVPCYCPACVSKYGKEIPDAECIAWLDYVNWYHQCYRDFYTQIAKVVHERYPKVNCVFNWEWSINHPEEPVPHIQQLAGDLFPSGKVSAFFSRYWSGTGLPFDYMNGRFMHGLGDWCSNTDLTLQYTAACTLANGGGIYVIDRQLTNGQLEARSYETMDTVFSFVNERRSWVTDTQLVPEVAVAVTCDHLVGSHLELFPDPKARKKRLEPVKAIGEILTEGGVHFTYLNEAKLIKHIHDYKLVILPELYDVSEILAMSLEQYAKNGGNILIIQGEEGEPNPRLLKLGGVLEAGKAPQHYTYIEYSRDGKTETPFVARGENSLIAAQAHTKVLSRLIAPLESIGGTFGHGFAPPAHRLDYVAAALRNVCDGQIIYVAPRLLSSYTEYFNPDISQFLLRLIERLLPMPLVRLHTTAPVEKSLRRQGNDLIIHLVNHAGSEVEAGGWCPITKYIPTITNITLTIQPGVGSEVSVFSSDKYTKKMTRTVDNATIEISGLSLYIMESVRVHNYFGI